MRDLVTRYFNEALNEIFTDKDGTSKYPDLKRSIEANSRKETFIDNLVKQIRMIEKRRTKGLQKDGTFKIGMDRKKIKQIVKDFVNLFGQAVIKKMEVDRGLTESKSKLWLPKVGSGIQMKVLSRRKGIKKVRGILVPGGLEL